MPTQPRKRRQRLDGLGFLMQLVSQQTTWGTFLIFNHVKRYPNTWADQLVYLDFTGSCTVEDLMRIKGQEALTPARLPQALISLQNRSKLVRGPLNGVPWT